MNSFQFAHSLSKTAIISHLVFCLFLIFISFVITKAMQVRIRIIDTPNIRSSHTAPTPKSGGIAIVTTFLLGILAIYFFGDKTPITQGYFIGFILSALAIAIVSFYDDINYKSFFVKLGSQIIAACVVIAFGIILDEIALPFFGLVKLSWLAYPITFFWIIGLTNAFNFMDGLDGLAGGVAVIASAFFGFITLSQGSTFVYITCYALLAGSLGFLILNFPPAKIFMGDVGSAFLGFVFATLAIIAARYDHSHTSFMVVPLLLFHFVFDTLLTFFRRLFKGEYVTQAHRTHLYQLMNRQGYSHRTVTILYYAMAIVQGIGAVYLVTIGGEKRIFVFLPYLISYSLFAYLVIKKAKQKGLLKKE